MLTFPYDRRTEEDLPSRTFKIPVVISTGMEPRLTSMYVTVGGLEGRPLEVFTSIGKVGSDESLLADCVSRLVSGWLQDGADPPRVLKHLLGMKGAGSVRWKAVDGFILSVPDAIGKAVLRWVAAEEEAKAKAKEEAKLAKSKAKAEAEAEVAADKAWDAKLKAETAKVIKKVRKPRKSRKKTT